MEYIAVTSDMPIETVQDFSHEIIGTADEVENILLIAPAPETVEETEVGMDVNFEPSNFVSNLGYMGTGMLGIFVVIAAIWAVTVALNKIFTDKKKDDENN